MRDGKVRRLIRELDKLTDQWNQTPVKDGLIVLPPVKLMVPLMIEADERAADDRLKWEIEAALQRSEQATQRLSSWAQED